MQRILNIVGWIGVAIVVAAVALKFRDEVFMQDRIATAVHTLSEQSQKVVGGLDAPLKILLFDQSERFPNYTDRLAQYKNASRQLSVEYVDGNLDPVRAKQFEILAFPTLVRQ